MGARRYRAHQRYQMILDAAVTATRRGVVAKGQLLDLGVGGAAMELDGPLRIGEAIDIIVSGGELKVAPMLLRGKVAWVAWGEASAVRLGVSFDDDSFDNVIALLDRHVTSDAVGA